MRFEKNVQKAIRCVALGGKARNAKDKVFVAYGQNILGLSKTVE
jgi:hypothetical protein